MKNLLFYCIIPILSAASSPTLAQTKADKKVIDLCKAALKESLDNPQSFQFHRAAFTKHKPPTGEKSVLIMDFGGSNAFGGIVRKATFCLIQKDQITASAKAGLPSDNYDSMVNNLFADEVKSDGSSIEAKPN